LTRNVLGTSGVVSEELRTVADVRTSADFEAVAADLADQGWRFVSTFLAEDQGQILVFSRSEVALGHTGAN
jgi:hypothetical protein